MKRQSYLFADYRRQRPANTVYTNRWIDTIIDTKLYLFGNLKPDIVDVTDKEIYEIKPLGSFGYATGQVNLYVLLLNTFDPEKRSWHAGSTYLPPSIIPIDSMSFAFVMPPMLGVIQYEVFDARLFASLAIAHQASYLKIQIGTRLALAPIIKF